MGFAGIICIQGSLTRETVKVWGILSITYDIVETLILFQ